MPKLTEAGVRVIVEHVGWPTVPEGTQQPGFQSVLQQDSLASWVPDEGARRAILWDTPSRMFGFTAT